VAVSLRETAASLPRTQTTTLACLPLVGANLLACRGRNFVSASRRALAFTVMRTLAPVPAGTSHLILPGHRVLPPAALTGATRGLRLR
jgi:hypothetical protein